MLKEKVGKMHQKIKGKGSQNASKDKECQQWLMPVIPALWEAKAHYRSGVQDQSDQHGETPSLPKIQKLSRVLWRAPVIPATREAETGESLEPKRQKLQ